MINFSLKGITAEELSFKVNRIKIENPKFEIKPAFTRQIRQANENPNIFIVALECKILTTDDSPKPFDLVARLVGVFDTDGIASDEDKKAFGAKATEIMFPFLRSAVASLTTTAMVSPLVLPVLPGGLLFPEDRPAQPQGNTGKQYTLSFDESLLN